MYQGYGNMGYSPTQMRLNQMEQMYPQYNNQMMYNNQYQGNQQVPQNNGNALKGRPVTSLEEARAAQIDFDGSVFFFPDIANGKIYTKQINLDGTATLKEYKAGSLPVNDEQVAESDSKDYLGMIEDLQNQINEIKKKIGGNKNVKSNANVRNDE